MAHASNPSPARRAPESMDANIAKLAEDCADEFEPVDGDVSCPVPDL